MRRIAAVAATIALLVPATALAQSSSTCSAYNPQTCTITNFHSGSGEPVSSGTLPFTGLDVLLLAIGGGTLVGAGLVVRRLSRRVS
jgi:hypothetical protein